MRTGTRVVGSLRDDAQSGGERPKDAWNPQKGASVGVQAATTDYGEALVLQQRGQIGSIKVYQFDRTEEAMTDLDAERITAMMKGAPA